MGIEKGIEAGQDDDKTTNKFFSEIKHEISAEVKRLSADNVALSRAVAEFKIVTFTGIGLIIAVLVIFTTAKIYAKNIIKQAKKETVREVIELS